jgi:hypothetical protein
MVKRLRVINGRIIEEIGSQAAGKIKAVHNNKNQVLEVAHF